MSKKVYKRSKWRIIARQVAHESVRNTYLETLHAKYFSDKQMRKLMLEIEENLRISFWFWDRKRNDQELIKKVEQGFFGESGVSWDNPKLAKDFKKLQKENGTEKNNS